MAIKKDGAAARQLSTLFHSGPIGSLTDGQLLERFATRPGEGAELAFAALVERHGSLVLRVCRSILRDNHAAHDAFQATFLVLVDKGGSLWVRDSLAPWLHAVAYRVALRARGSAARRKRHEHARSLASSEEASDQILEARELGEVLHEEIEALPERYRVPIVLCDLEGRSHDEAARHLGWPVGTVKSRQARGRDRLRDRLARRGVAPSAGSLGSGPLASPQLIQSTAALAAKVSAGGFGAASVPAASLAKEVLMGMLIGKMKLAGFTLLGLALVAAGTLAFAPGGASERYAVRRMMRTDVRDDVPADRVGKIYLGVDGGVMAFDPKTGESSRLLIECKMRPRISPDGRWIAFEKGDAVWVRELEKLDEPRKLLDLDGAAFGTPVWSPDSAKLIISLGTRDEKGESWRFKTVRINLDGTGREELTIPPEDGVQDWAPGDRLVATSSRNAQIGWELYVMKPNGSEQRQITEGGNPYYTRSSPDGRRVLYADGTTDERRGIWVVGIDGQNRRKVLPVLGAMNWSACWSPDGKRIAVVIWEKAKAGGTPKHRLVIQEVDGDGRAEFPIEDMKNADMPDWR